MRQLLAGGLVLITVACSNAIDDLPPEISPGRISGVAYDGVIRDAQVSVYRFTGQDGPALAHATTDANGGYDIALSLDDQPLLLEIRGGSYVEEASERTVELQPEQRLRAVANYTQGRPLTLHATYWTTLAAGLAEYKVRIGATPTQAVTAANREINELLALDVTTVTPQNPTSAGSGNQLTPELAYGFLLAALSKWTADASEKNGAVIHETYNSIALTQLAYDDIRYDGILDGYGKTGALGFGGLPLTQSTYQHDIATYVLRMAQDRRNASGITSDKLVDISRRLNDTSGGIFNQPPAYTYKNNSPMFSGVEPRNNSTVHGVFTSRATVTDAIGVSKVDFIVDDTLVARAADPDSPVVTIDSSAFTDGGHVLQIRAENLAGSASNSAQRIDISNWATRITELWPAPGSSVRGTITAGASIADPAGLSSVTLRLDGKDLGAVENLEQPGKDVDTTLLADGPHEFLLTSTNTSRFSLSAVADFNVDNTPPAILGYSPAGSLLLANDIPLSAQVQDAHLNDVAFLLDGETLATSGEASPSFTLQSSRYGDGPHQLGVRARDRAGNESITTTPVVFDNTPPKIIPIIQGKPVDISLAIRGTYLNWSSEIGAQVVEANPAQLSLSFDGEPPFPLQNYAAPRFNLRDYPLSNGPHTFAFHATDRTGHDGVANWSFTYDDTAPAAQISISYTGSNCSGKPYDCTCVISGVTYDNIGVLHSLVNEVELSTASYPWVYRFPVPPANDQPMCVNGRSTSKAVFTFIDLAGNSRRQVFSWCQDVYSLDPNNALPLAVVSRCYEETP